MKPISEKKLTKDFNKVRNLIRKEVKKAIKYRKLSDKDLAILLGKQEHIVTWQRVDEVDKELHILSNFATALDCKLVIELVPLSPYDFKNIKYWNPHTPNPIIADKE